MDPPFDNPQHQKMKNDVQLFEKKLQYDLIKESIKTEFNDCIAFIFNNKGDTLIVASREVIIVYQFNDGIIVKEIQRLNNYTSDVTCLYFMKQSNSFISGSNDNSIIVWEFDKNRRKWFAKIQFKEHNAFIECIVMNKKEDFFISGSLDHTIKFWNKNKLNWICQQSIDTVDAVYDISLTEKENYLISSLAHHIQILERGSDEIWRIVQTLDTQCKRLCFTIGDQFVFSRCDSDKMEVYDYDQSRKQFEKLQEVQIFQQEDSIILFPCQFIQQLKIITINMVNIQIYFKLIQMVNINYYKQLIFAVPIYLAGQLMMDIILLLGIVQQNKSK